MLQITDIPLTDVIKYLSLNEQPISKNTDRIYSDAANLINSGKAMKSYYPIDDFIIANNLLSQNITFPIYNASSILLASDTELERLAYKLTLTYVDKERIIRILNYLGDINYDINIFDTLPADILKNIVSYLDCKTIILICKLSTGFSKFCDIHLDNILRENLKRKTRFNTRGYNRYQLLTLCKFSDNIINKNISTRYDHVLILKRDGTVYSFGRNGYGQLGLGNNDEVNNPTIIPGFNNIISISAGEGFSVILNQ